MIGTRTRLINQMRAFCLEYGVALRQGAGLFKLDLPDALKDPANDLSPAMRKLLGNLFDDLRQLEKRIADVTHEIEAIADREDAARRLMTIPRDRSSRCDSTACCYWKRQTVPESA